MMTLSLASRCLTVQTVIVWFRRNLRLQDNAALAAAANSELPIVPVYVVDEQDVGGARRWWLHHSLTSLDRQLRDLGSALVIRPGDPAEVLSKLAAEAGATALYFSRRYEPASRRQEERVQAEVDLDVHEFEDSFLINPGALLTAGGTPYRVFTPFWNAARSLGEPPLPKRAPKATTFVQPGFASEPDLGLLPTKPDWAGGLRDTWEPGEPGASGRIDALDDALVHYATRRDRPDMDATSRLSPHLAFGEISPRQVWHAVRRLELPLQATAGSEALLRQLYWREFSNYLLFHFPELPRKPLRSEFEAFPWSDDDSLLSAWQEGRTGYPIVDAGMRQLWTTGWMHNRVRMIAASFLVKDLLIPWQRGAEWFLDTLVDADLANNSASWQWVAGCGTDAAPYFRIFNPTIQAEKFDPQGHYVRRWIPELSENGGADYPPPIVDHREARHRALEAYASIKGMRTSKVAPGPRGSSNRSSPP